MTFEECTKVLDEICALKQGWGEDYEPISLTAISAARVLIGKIHEFGEYGLTYPDRIVPSPDTCVILAWIDGGEVVYQIEADEKGLLSGPC